jgi:hypothetical protein
VGQAGPGPARERQADGLQQLVQQRASPGVSRGQARDLLSEGAGPAVVVVAEEAADPQSQHDPAASDRRVMPAAAHSGCAPALTCARTQDTSLRPLAPVASSGVVYDEVGDERLVGS